MQIQGINTSDYDNPLLQELLESVEGIFFILDKNYQVLYWSKKVIEVTGIKTEEILHKSIYDFFPGIKGDSLDEVFQNAMKTRKKDSCEQEYTISGEKHVFETLTVPCSVGLFVFGKDITQQKKEVELHKQEKEFFQTVIDNIPIFLLKMNPDNEITWVNNPFQEKLGYSSKEIREQKVLNTLFSKQQEIDIVPEFINITEHHWEDFNTLTRDGVQIITSWTLVKLSDGSKIGIGQDVTEKRKQFEELSQLNQHINAIINNLPVVLLSTDFEGRYKSLMGMGLERLNLKAGDLIGKSAYQIYGNLYFDSTENDISTVKEAIDTVLMDKSVSGNLELNNKIFNLKMVAEKDNNKEITGLLGVALDITERSTAEKELQSTNQLLEKTLDSLKEVVLVVGTEEKRGIILCNNAIKNMFGYEPDELMGQTTKILHLDDEHYEEFGKTGEYYLEKYGSFQGEFVMKRKDGSIINTEHTIQPLDENKGWKYGVVSIIRDISETRKYRKQIESYSNRLKKLTSHLQKVQEEERARIAREIHDELGQIFSIMKFNLSSLSKDLSENKNYLDTNYIKDEVEAMESMANQAIQTTRRFISELRPVIIDHMTLDEALNWLINDFETRTNIKTKYNNQAKEASVNEEVKINFFRILQESLTNVNRHAKATKVLVTLKKADNHLTLKIEDDGIGIEDNQKQKADSFGLMGIQERVNNMEGELTIEGEEYKGTKIVVQIPLKV